MKNFFKDYFRRFLIGAAAVVLTVAVSGLAVLIAWLIVRDGDNPLYYLIILGIMWGIVPLIGAQPRPPANLAWLSLLVFNAKRKVHSAARSAASSAGNGTAKHFQSSRSKLRLSMARRSRRTPGTSL